jgi:plastocyanin
MRSRLWLIPFALVVASPARAATGSVAGKVTAGADSPFLWIVYLEGGAPPRPVAEGPPKEILQEDVKFKPSVAYVALGTTLAFPNRDKFYHNAFSPTTGNQFDLGLYRGGVTKSVTLRAPGEVDIYCNIHPDMYARVLVLPSSLYAEVASDGSYEVKGVPPGKYTVVAWSPRHQPQRQEVTVAAGRPATATFSLRGRPFPSRHLNKSGEPYGRYK